MFKKKATLIVHEEQIVHLAALSCTSDSIMAKSLFHTNISIPPPSSFSPNTTNFTSTSRNVTVSSHPQQQQYTSLANFSISDKDLSSRGFDFRRSTDGLNLEQLNSVFVSVGFPKRDPDKVRVALENTDAIVWVENAKNRRPVAFARATGDGVFNAIIWDVVVDPSYQGIGLGKAVMERLLADLVGKGITNIALYSEPRVLGFYRPLGFIADPDGIRGMVFSRKPKKK